jgi:CBS domain-containing protein
MLEHLLTSSSRSAEMSDALIQTSDTVVCDMMSQNVIFVQDTDTVLHAAAVVEEFKISGAPVVNAYGHCVGVLSVKDYSRRSGVNEEKLIVDEAATVGDVMTTPAITVSPGLDIAEAGRIMVDRRVHRLPVVDETGRLVGLLSSLDVIEALAWTTQD